MTEMMERRREKRLRYNWPVWFMEELHEDMCQGQMVDISSGGAAFTCYADRCPQPGQTIKARFSVPQYNQEQADSFDLANFTKEGTICRVDEISAFVRRVAVQFADPLPFKPGEVTDTDALLVDETVGMMGGEKMDEEVEHAVAEAEEAVAAAETAMAKAKSQDAEPIS